MVQATENAVVKSTDTHLTKFEQRFKNEASQPSWLFPLRKSGIVRFAEMGFPTLNDEDWRYTNVAPIAKLPFRPIFKSSAEGLTLESVAKFTFGSLSAIRLVFVNGNFVAALSTQPALPEGITVSSLAQALTMQPAQVEKQLGRNLQSQENAFAALNTAFFLDGGYVHVPAGKVLETPVHLLFISTTRENGSTSHPRNLLVLDDHAQATVIESYVSTIDGAYVTNAVTEIIAGEGAILEHCKLQDESLCAYHLATIHAQLAKGSNVVSHSFAAGARLSRNSIRTQLSGEGVECVLNGLYLTKGDQLADHHMVVEHAEPHCNSHEYFNGILDGRSRGVFHGRILVRQIAQKTDAKQTNKNLLLSEDAGVDTKPQLEIYADDVKCTHGATIGQLNDESIFYLRARGIGADTARRMLIHAFAGEIIERIRHSATREVLDKVVWDRLEANPHIAEPHHHV
jgi:Fe-S cluster assembly protein SufD